MQNSRLVVSRELIIRHTYYLGIDEALSERDSLMEVSSTEPDGDEVMVLDNFSGDLGKKFKFSSKVGANNLVKIPRY